MKILERIYNLDIAKLPDPNIPTKDPLINGIKKNMFIELPVEKGEGYHLINSNLKLFRKKEVTEDGYINNILVERRSTLRFLIEKMVETCINNSAIFESNSYYIIQNDFLVIGRIKRFFKDDETFEIKFYTLQKKDLEKHYTDKIYIGGTFLNLNYPNLPYGGLNLYIDSLYDQLETLNFKAKTKLTNLKKYKKTFFLEIKELVEETVSKSINIFTQIPSKIVIKKMSTDELVNTLSILREMKHYYLELSGEVGEFENVLRIDKEENYARYVTKFKKDLKNTINYINFNFIVPLLEIIKKS